MTRRVYIRLLRIYMNWISIADDDYDTMLQKDPRLIASDIIDFVIYLRNEKKLAPASINIQICPTSLL